MVLAPGLTPALSAVLMAVSRGLAGDTPQFTTGLYHRVTTTPPNALCHLRSHPRVPRSLVCLFVCLFVCSPTLPDAKPVSDNGSAPRSSSSFDAGLESDWDSDDDDFTDSDDDLEDTAGRLLEAAPIGTVLEFSPSCNGLAYELAQRIGTTGGGASLLLSAASSTLLCSAQLCLCVCVFGGGGGGGGSAYVDHCCLLRVV